jgi:hypothetical protein
MNQYAELKTNTYSKEEEIESIKVTLAEALKYLRIRFRFKKRFIF